MSIKKRQVGLTAKDNQTPFVIRMLGNGCKPQADEIVLGRFELVGVPRTGEAPPTQLTVDVDTNGIDRISIMDKATRLQRRYRIQAAGSVSGINIEPVIGGSGDRSAAGERWDESDVRRMSDFHAALLTMAGHDVRQPLQVILGTHEFLAKRLAAGTEREHLERGSRALQQLIDLLDHLVEALHVHKRKADVGTRRVPLNPLFKVLEREHAEAAQQGAVDLRVVGTRAVAMSDELLLSGILRNLVRNALKYTPPGGRVLVGCRRHATGLRLEVHDTGIGIPADRLADIFQAFRQLDPSHSEGLGLGLSIVKRAAGLLGHHIEVRSSIGQGSCFAVLAESARMAGGVRDGRGRERLGARRG